MARGNRIVVTNDPKGKVEWGYLAGAYKPGTILQIDASAGFTAGKNTWTAYSRDADGDRPKGPFVVLTEDLLQGRDAVTAYASGDFARMYTPLPGDEMNLLFGDTAGTADDLALGDQLIADDGTGKVVKSAGTPETEVATALEAITDPVADQLVHCIWTGH